MLPNTRDDPLLAVLLAEPPASRQDSYAEQPLWSPEERRALREASASPRLADGRSAAEIRRVLLARFDREGD